MESKTDRRTQRALSSATSMLEAWEADPDSIADSSEAAVAWLERLERLVPRAWPSPRAASPPLRVAAPLHLLAELCWSRGDLERADVTLGRVLEILAAHRLPTDAEYLRAVGRRATWVERMGDPARADAILREAAERLDDPPRGKEEGERGGTPGGEGASTARALALAVLDGQWADLAYERGQFDRARRRCTEGLARLGEVGRADGYRDGAPGAPTPDPRVAAVAVELWSQAFAADLGRGDPLAAGRSIDAAEHAWARTGDRTPALGPSARITVLARRVTLALVRNDLDRAESELSPLSAQLESGPAPTDASGRRAFALIRQLEGMLAQRRGRHRDAVDAFEQSIAHRRPRRGRAGILDPSQDLVHAPLEHALMAVSLARLGDVREGQAVVGRVLELGRKVPLRCDASLVVLRCYGEVMLAAGELDTARAALEQARAGLVTRFGERDPRARRVDDLLAHAHR